MTREEEIQKIWQESLLQRNGCGTTVIACLVLVILLFCSCATKKEIEYRDRIVEKEIVKEVHDTLLESVHDSVFQTVYQKGDTVYSEKYVEHTKWRDRVVVKSDTCWRDSIHTEYKETTKEVQKIPKIFWLSMVFSIIIVIFAIIKLVRWLQTHYPKILHLQ